METLFQKIVSIDQNLYAILLLAIFFSVEQFFNTGFKSNKRLGHLLHSLLLQFGYVIVSFFLAFVMVACFQWFEAHRVGLLYHIAVHFPLRIVIGLLCFDFTFYWAHRSYHLLPLFWRLHRVHHSDNKVDSATSFRFHPFDALLDTATAIVAGAIFGLDINVVLFFFILYLPLLFAQHTNFIFPAWTDKVLGNILAVPNFHKVHHHRQQEFTDTNYGNLFIFWDKLFGTFRCIPVSEIKFGLEEFDEQKKQTAWYLIKSPFLNIRRIKGANKTADS